MLNSFDNFALSSADKVTIGTHNFVSVVLKNALSEPVASAFAPTGAEVNTQISIHPNESSILQLINGVSNDLQKLLKYFRGKAIFILFFFVVPFISVLPIRFALYLNELALLSLVTSALSTISFLLKSRKLPEVSE